MKGRGSPPTCPQNAGRAEMFLGREKIPEHTPRAWGGRGIPRQAEGSVKEEAAVRATLFRQ